MLPRASALTSRTRLWSLANQYSATWKSVGSSVVNDLENLYEPLRCRVFTTDTDVLGFFALSVLVLAVLCFECIIGVPFNLGLDDVVDTDAALLQSLDFDNGEGLDELAIIDKLVGRVRILCRDVRWGRFAHPAYVPTSSMGLVGTIMRSLSTIS